MSAQDIVIKRTGMTAGDADFYVMLAEMIIRQHCGLTEEDDISQYLFQIADIATLMWQTDESTKATAGNLGYESVSFTEGGVSRKEATLTGSYIHGAYSQAIADILADIDETRGVGGLVIW